MSIVLVGSTSGSITLQEPAVAGTTVLDLPATSGTVALTSQLLASPSAVGQIPFSTDGSTYTATAKIVSGTAVASTSGTSIDFTSIPSWVKRVTVMYSGVSTNSTSALLVQIGSGSVTTSGYVGSVAGVNGATSASATLSAGFSVTRTTVAANTYQGVMTIVNVSGNTWSASWNTGDSSTTVTYGAGTLALGGVLDRIRITTVNGTDTFDAGTINILYE